MIFLDTSAIFAMADTTDGKHEVAVRIFDEVQQSGEEVITHNYIVVESAALMQRRLGLKSAVAFLAESASLDVRWVSPATHYEAAEYLAKRGGGKVSFVDAVSFVMMRQEGISRYIGFDGHFEAEGFTALPMQGS